MVYFLMIEEGKNELVVVHAIKNIGFMTDSSTKECNGTDPQLVCGDSAVRLPKLKQVASLGGEKSGLSAIENSNYRAVGRRARAGD